MPTVRALLSNGDPVPRLRCSPGHEGLRRFTVFARFDEDTVEEIDVDAVSKQDARRLVERLLSPEVNCYELGGRIVDCVERFGLYL